jgi:hypothetical protein
MCAAHRLYGVSSLYFNTGARQRSEWALASRHVSKMTTYILQDLEDHQATMREIEKKVRSQTHPNRLSAFGDHIGF